MLINGGWRYAERVVHSAAEHGEKLQP